MITDYEKRLIEQSDFDEEKKEEIRKLTDEGYPLAYQLGYWYFWRDRFIVNRQCLIPRPDTEKVVEVAVESVPERGEIADLCSGCGCIGLSVLRDRKDVISCIGVDISADANDVAAQNAVTLGLDSRYSVRKADVLNEFPLDKKYDCIISNPPYIRSNDISKNEYLAFEPLIALDGGDDGLVFYRRFLKDYKRFLKKDGFFIFEIGFDQADDLRKLSGEFGYKCVIKKDYGSNDRVAVLYKQEID